MGRRGWVFAVVLTAVAAAYFAPLGDWVAENPLPGQTWMKQNTGLALSVFALVTLVAGGLAWQRRERTLDAVADQAFDPRADGHLDDLRRRMKVVWIDEFLARSLERIVPAKLGFAERRDAITGPLRVVGTPTLTGIVEIFADERTARRLVVLGAPGAGKTTQLLRLAEHLLADPDGPVPIVVSLSGSSWKVDPYKLAGLHRALLRPRSAEDGEEESAEDLAMRQQRLTEAKQAQLELAVDTAVEWLAWEIGRLYQVPPKRVRRWLRADRSPVVLLLDGLDEIRDLDDRRRCVEVLSLLRSRLNAGMVVCSRVDEYFESGRRLEFGVAVQIEPLRPLDVDDYLREAGPELASLRAACDRNPELVRLLDTPLTLTVAVLTYRGRHVDDALVRELIDNDLDRLWSAYLTEALPRQRGLTSTASYGDGQSLHHMRGLAVLMESAGRDTFTVDGLNLSWLSRPERSAGAELTRAYLAAAVGCAAAVIGHAAITAGAVAGVVSAGVLSATALVYWRSAGKVPEAGESRLVRARFVSAHWRLDWRGAQGSFVRVLLTGVAIGVAIGTVGGNLGWMDGFHGLLLGLIPGLTAGLAAGVLTLPDQAVARTTPHGRRASAARRTLVVRLGTGAAALLVLGSAHVLSGSVAEPLRPALLHATIAGITGIWLVGFAVSMHGWWSHRAALRLVVRAGMLPRDVEAFLAHTEERIITRRRLDGHAFLHRTLQSHLAAAAVNPGPTRAQPGTPDAPPAAHPG
ncbi:hypothetical protein ABTZ99_25655 [Actinosynnema sp. NPDC002837]